MTSKCRRALIYRHWTVEDEPFYVGGPHVEDKVVQVVEGEGGVSLFSVHPKTGYVEIHYFGGAVDHIPPGQVLRFYGEYVKN